MSAADLLAWYDRNARELPWRAPPGAGRTPAYRVWLSEIMLQQTTVTTVKPYFVRFLNLWPTVHDLAAAPREDVLAEWAGLGYYARARNLHKCAGVVADDLGGRFPETKDTLLALPGVGPYTAGAIAAIAFDRPEAAVDGNVERVMSRRYRIETPLPDAKVEITARTQAMIPAGRPGDFAQALMDLGATICTPRSPNCLICPWRDACEGRGIAEKLPVKAPKKVKPVRRGVAFAHLTDQGVLVETRPDKGLLGGMIGLPGTEWSVAGPTEAEIEAAIPTPAIWREIGEARHTFTHFHLILTVMIARGKPKRGGKYLPLTKAKGAAPTVMKKAMDLVQ